MARVLSQEFISLQKACIENRKADYLKYPQYVNEGREIPERSTFKLNKIVPRLNAALEVIEKGAYGICIDCEDEISMKRLQLIPAAIRCVDCQFKSEV